MRISMSYSSQRPHDLVKPEMLIWCTRECRDRVHSRRASGRKGQVWIGKSRIAGTGLIDGQAITKDTIISRYRGTKISKAQSARALAHGNAYICYLNNRYDLDGNTLQNPARYINHSCDPNCALQTTGRAI